MSALPAQRRQFMAFFASGLRRIWRGVKYLFGALVVFFLGKRYAHFHRRFRQALASNRFRIVRASYRCSRTCAR
jgi:hypothetical protein